MNLENFHEEEQRLEHCPEKPSRDLSYNNFTGEIPYNIGYLQVSTL
jgi:hypothetical protein